MVVLANLGWTDIGWPWTCDLWAYSHCIGKGPFKLVLGFAVGQENNMTPFSIYLGFLTHPTVEHPTVSQPIMDNGGVDNPKPLAPLLPRPPATPTPPFKKKYIYNWTPSKKINV